MIFIHKAPNCYLLTEDGEKGVFFKATCTACPDRGIECDAKDGKCDWFYHEDERAHSERLEYNETRAELEAICKAMNPKLLDEWKADRAKRHEA